MTCTKCGTMYPVYYDKCPKCKATEAKHTEYKTDKRPKTQEFFEPISAMVIGSELSQGDTDFQR